MVISKQKIRFPILILICILFFKPLAINSLPEYSTLNTLWDMARVCVCIIIVFKMLFERYLPKTLIIIIICYGIFLLSTLINRGNVRSLIIQMASVIGFCMLIYLESRKDIHRFFLALFYGLSILIILHTIFMIIKPNGLGYDTVYYNSIYFLASKNGLTKFFFPAIISGFVLCELEGGKIQKKVIAIVLLCFVLSIIVKSITTIIGMIICVGFYWFSKSKKFGQYFNVNKVSMGILIFAIAMSILAFNDGLNSIVSYFVDTQKASNYLDRTIIWSKAIDMIKKSFLVGYGMPYNGGHINVNGKYMYSHNGYLEFFLYGGIIGFLFCLMLLFYVLRKHKNIKKNSACIPVLCGIIGFVIMMITESHINTIAYWGFFVMFEQLYNYERKNINGGINQVNESI